jgi:peptidase E
MHKSGFSDIIIRFLDNGMVYGGESAGAVVAGSTLKGVDQVDDPKEAPGVVWEGLGLMDKGIIPNWGWEKYATEIKAAREVMAETTEIIMIDNDHAVIIEDGIERIVDNPAAL